MLAGSRERAASSSSSKGFIDFHQLRARGFENVAALGGTSTSPQTFERLSRLGVETVTLCLDNDDAGSRRDGARRRELGARTAAARPSTWSAPSVSARRRIRTRSSGAQGTDAWRDTARDRECGIGWRARELVAGCRRPMDPLAERRDALGRAGEWLGTLPPRLALEQEDAVRVVAERCGYYAERSSAPFERASGASTRERGASALS